MTRIALLLLVVPSLALADRSYNAERKVNHDCNAEPNVSINVSSAEYTFTGACKRISINGSSSDITIETVNKLSVNGSMNKVEVRGADRISVNGSKNKVSYETAANGKGKPKVSSLGSGNQITRK
jgi:hypothetical protein